MPEDQERTTSLTLTERQQKIYRFQLVASWLGQALGGDPSIHGGYCRSNSTHKPLIGIAQAKTKWSEIRIYCDALETKQQKVWYRQIHLEAKALFPEFWSAILGGADYWQYICETPEEFEARIQNFSADPEWFTATRKDAYDLCRWELPDEICKSDEQA